MVVAWRFRQIGAEVAHGNFADMQATQPPRTLKRGIADPQLLRCGPPCCQLYSPLVLRLADRSGPACRAKGVCAAPRQCGLYLTGFVQ